MAIIAADGFKISKTNTPTREGERIATLADITNREKVPNPFVGMLIFVEDEQAHYVVLELGSDKIGGIEVSNVVVSKYKKVEVEDGSISKKKLSNEVQKELETLEKNAAQAKIAADKAAADIGVDSTTLLQGGIDSDGSENSSSYFLRTGRYSTFKLEVNDGYTIGQIAQYDLAGNFVNLYNGYQSLVGVEWTPTSVVATDKNYYWVAIVFKGNSPTTAISPREAVVKIFVSGLHYYMQGGESDPQSAAQQAKTIVNRTIEQLPNTEDLALVDEKMQLANRAAEIKDDKVSSLGYVVLRKNKSFAEQVVEPNCIYEIRYKFDLGGSGKTVTLKEGCTLKFEGGRLSNGTLQCNNTYIEGAVSCFSDVALQGKVVNNAKLSWFGIYGSNPNNDVEFNKLVNHTGVSTYEVDSNIDFNKGDLLPPKHKTFLGNGHTLSFYCESTQYAWMILTEGLGIKDLKFYAKYYNSETNTFYSGIGLLADTSITNVDTEKVHYFKLDNVEVSGYWNSGKSYDMTALRLKVENHITANKEDAEYDNTGNYITGVTISNFKSQWVKVGIELLDIVHGTTVAGDKDFPWLNEVYIKGLDIHALEAGIKTNYTNNAVSGTHTNIPNSIGPIYINQFKFQSLSVDSVMFDHNGNWSMEIVSGFCWDCTYKGIIRRGGDVATFNVFGCYQKDTTVYADDGTTIDYRLKDSVKVYGNSGYYKNSYTTIDRVAYRQGNYNPADGRQVWRQYCREKTFVTEEGEGYVSEELTKYGNSTIIKKYRTSGPSMYKVFRQNVGSTGVSGAGCITYTYNSNYGYNDNYTLLDLNRNYKGANTTAFKECSLVNSSGLTERYSVKAGFPNGVSAGRRLRGKYKILFRVDGVECNYTTYLTKYDFVKISSPNVASQYFSVEKSYYSVEGDDLYFNFDGYVHKEIYTANIEFGMTYNKDVPVSRIIKNEATNNNPFISITPEMFIYGVERVLLEAYSVATITSGRPTGISIGFQFFDTTLGKPIWWNGSKWVDSAGTAV